MEPATGHSSPEPVDALLRGCREGDRDCFDRLFALLYDELRVIARRHLRELGSGGSATLNTTAVVHESYLKLAGGAEPRWQERAQFFAVASKAMRHILVDYARRRAADKRGGGMTPVTLHDDTTVAEDRTVALLELDDGLARLAARVPRLESIVECRFFGGMTVAETAEALGISPRTVERDWTRARAYL
jgi:RNA polymerase sigma-70 factor, ECF subfamily